METPVRGQVEDLHLNSDSQSPDVVQTRSYLEALQRK